MAGERSSTAGLKAVATKIELLIQSHPGHMPARFTRPLLASYAAKANELHDPGENFGQFASDIVCGGGLTKARGAAATQASGLEPPGIDSILESVPDFTRVQTL